MSLKYRSRQHHDASLTHAYTTQRHVTRCTSTTRIRYQSRPILHRPSRKG
jgi:hypothetical protein